MTVRQTVPRLKAFAYAVRSLWGFHVIYGKTGHGNLEIDLSHDIGSDKLMVRHFGCGDTLLVGTDIHRKSTVDQSYSLHMDHLDNKWERRIYSTVLVLRVDYSYGYEYV